MKLTSAVLLGLASLCAGAATAGTAASPLLVIHGGAGVERGDLNPEEMRAARTALEAALRKGHEALLAGKPAMDAVTAAITVLEDDPTFNAGRGAVFTHDGRNELDASLMDGATLRAGAVAGVHTIKNPILLARAVMEHSPHVMMVGQGAEVFAAEQKIEQVDPSYFRTEKRWQQLQRALKEEAAGQAHVDLETAKHFGTVGAVALDAQGKLAAGTSTGGMTNKRYGRVGDSPVIGAGTYASNQTCGVSSTGHGEYYIRLGFARDISALMEYRQLTVQEACQTEIQKLTQLGGTGGVIALDRHGNISMEFNTSGMFRGYIKSNGERFAGIFKD